MHKEKDEAAAKAQAKAKAKAEKLAAKAKAKADVEQAIVDTKAKKLADKQAAEQKAAEVAAAKKQVKSNLSQPKVEQPKVEPPKTSAAVKTLDTPEQAQAREAIAHLMFQEAANNSSTPAAKPAVKAEVKPKKAEKPTVAAKPKLMEPAKAVTPAIVSAAPPLPINSVQQHKLAELLTKYKADMVTPAEYQNLRAEILANP